MPEPNPGATRDTSVRRCPFPLTRKLRDVLDIPIAEMLFIGDAIFPGGNDYAGLEAGTETIAVRSPDDTKRVIRAILACES